MRLFRGVIIVLIGILLFSSNTYASTTQTTPIQNMDKANALKTFGLFEGSTTGFDLDKVPDRLQAAVMIVRLLGKEAYAKKSSFKHPYKDVPTWASPYIGYMYHYKLTSGFSSEIYGSATPVTASQYTTFVLRALGYSDTKGDFTVNSALTYAIKVGLLNNEESKKLVSKKFIRDDMVGISYNSLYTALKGEDKLLLDKLISEEAVSVNNAAAASVTKLPEVKSNIESGFVIELYDEGYRSPFVMYIDKAKLPAHLQDAYYCRLSTITKGASDDQIKQAATSFMGNTVKINNSLTFMNTLSMGESLAIISLYDKNKSPIAYKLVSPEDYTYCDSHFIIFRGQFYSTKLTNKDFTVKRYINGAEDTSFPKDASYSVSYNGGPFGDFTSGPFIRENESVTYEFVINNPLLKNIEQKTIDR